MGVMKVKKGSVKEVSETAVDQAVLPQVKQSERGKRFNEIKRKHPGVVAEDAALASESGNVFLMNNGTKKAILYPHPVNYYDEVEGVWKEIDNSLEEKDDCFETKQGKVKTQVRKIPFGKSVRVSKGQKAVEWEYVGNGKRTAKQGALSVKSVVAKKGQAVYEEVEDGVDIVYVMKGNGVKENIIVKKKAEEYRYVFKLKTEGLKLRLSEDNEKIELYSDEKVEFVIPSPYMYDASGRRSDEVSYELESDAEGAYAFAVVADKDWINSEETTLPVTIDPQIVEEGEQSFSLINIYKTTDTSGNTVTQQFYEDTIRVGKNNENGKEVEYYCNIHIGKKTIDYLKGQNAIGVYLVFTPVNKDSAGTLTFNDESVSYDSKMGSLRLEITNLFGATGSKRLKATEGFFEFCNDEFAPHIEVEYTYNENINYHKKDIALLDGVMAHLNCSTGEVTQMFHDLSLELSIKGISIEHIYKQNEGVPSLGGNYRLNLHENLKKHADELYVYTDKFGNKYAMTQYHYRIDANGNKEYLIISEDQIEICSDGTLMYEGERVYSEYKSMTGLTVITNIEDYKYFQYIELRNDEEKSLEEELKKYKSALDSITLVDNSDVDNIVVKEELKECILTPALFDMFLRVAEGEDYKLASFGAILSDEEMGEALEEITVYYKEYINTKEKLDEFWLQNPINFLTDGRIVKGYNKYGDLVALFDKYGGQVFIEYEKSGVNLGVARISRIYDDKERVVQFSYNKNGRLSCIADDKGEKVSYIYDEDGELKEFVNNYGKHIVVGYSASDSSEGKAISWVEDKNTCRACSLTWSNTTLTIQPDSTVSLIDIDGESGTENWSMWFTRFEFTFGLTNLTEELLIEFEYDHKEKYCFDNNGNLTQYYLEENGVVVAAEKYEYAPPWMGTTRNEGARYKVTKAVKSSLYLYKLENYTFEEGEIETNLLDQFNNIYQKSTSPIDIGGTVENKKSTLVEYKYDDNQRLLEEKTTITYTASGDCVSYKKYTYNAIGDVVRIENYVQGEEYTKGKLIQERAFDDKGNLIEEVSYNSLDTSSKFYSQTEYDDDGKVLAEYDESGEYKVVYDYVPNTSLIREKKGPNGGKFAYGYDLDGTVSSITQSTAEGEENSSQRVYRYGELVQISSGNNKVGYRYDSKRRLAKVSLNERVNYFSLSYANWQENGSVVGEKVSKHYHTGTKVENYYDHTKRLHKTQINNVSIVENTYDKDLLAAQTDYLAQKTYRFQYDDLGRKQFVYQKDISQENLPEYVVEAYTYGGYGEIYSVSSTIGCSYTYQYEDNSERGLKSIQIDGNIKVELKRDNLGRYVGRKVLFGDTQRLEEDIYYKKVGDHATNLPSSVWYTVNANGTTGFAQENIRYVYDSMGNIVEVYQDGELAISYEYDSLGRLVRENNKALDKTTIWVYDNYGNILRKKTYDFTLRDSLKLELLESTDDSYVYDGDKLLSYNNEDCTYNSVGNPTIYRGKALTWQYENRLVGYDTQTFDYDAFGRRIRKGDLTFTYDSEGRLAAQSNGLKFFYDHTGVAGFTYSNQTYFYMKSVKGDIIALLDSTGFVTARYTYDAFGNHVVTDNYGNTLAYMPSHPGNLNPFRYRGYYYDVETNLYYLKARYYDSVVGRFISMDDIACLDPETINGLNLYAYCANNPVMNIDPEGRAWLVFLVAAIIGFGVAFAASTISQAALNNGNINWGIAVIDGLFGALSAALWMIPGLGPVATGFINAGLTAANMFITTGIENNWQYTWEDGVSIAASALVSGIFSGVTRGLFFQTGGKDLLKNAHSQVSNIVRRLGNGSYFQRLSYQSGVKATKSAKQHVAKILLKLNFSSGFYLDWLQEFAEAMSSAAFSKGMRRLKW